MLIFAPRIKAQHDYSRTAMRVISDYIKTVNLIDLGKVGSRSECNLMSYMNFAYIFTQHLLAASIV